MTEQIYSNELRDVLFSGKPVYNSNYPYVKRDKSGYYRDIMGSLIRELNDNNVYSYTWFPYDTSNNEGVIDTKLNTIYQAILVLHQKVDRMYVHFK